MLIPVLKVNVLVSGAAHTKRSAYCNFVRYIAVHERKFNTVRAKDS